jgi:alpha-methylacyl-CoA racemase
MGALAGVTVVELAGIGPGPFAGMMLADHGARVIRVERPGAKPDPTDVLTRSREVVHHDLKSPDGVAAVRALARDADGLIEGFRPGVTERLGLGPDVLLGDNPRLVYGRMTGWGQQGPLAQAAGHDINYIALAGALDAIGREGERPVPPLNLVGDFGGGGMLLAFGMVAGILSARTTGKGQVVDCAMVDGAALLMSMMWGFRAKGMWADARGTNLLDTGAAHYDVYATADGGHVSIGALEPAFYAELLQRTGQAEDPILAQQYGGDPAARRARWAAVFAGRTQAEWCAALEGTDACFAPVLGFDAAAAHPHLAGRRTFVEAGGVMQPAPAPRAPGERA